MSWSLTKEHALRDLTAGGVPYHVGLMSLAEVEDGAIDKAMREARAITAADEYALALAKELGLDWPAPHWPKEKQMRVLVDGTTADGIHVRVEEGEGSYLTRFRVLIDGEEVAYSRASRRRDGGTTTIETERGTIFRPNRLPHPDARPATFNGEPLAASGVSPSEPSRATDA